MQNILLINNLFSPTNGADLMVYQLYKELRARGYTAEIFACNRQPYFEDDYKYQEFFPDAFELEEMNKWQKLRHLFQPMFNDQAYSKLKALYKVFRPDVVHLHGIQRYLSPSVIQATAEENIPMVMTLHDSFYLCPASTLMKAEQEYCGDYLCATDGPIHCIKNKCMRGSPVKSIYNAAEFKLRSLHKLYDQVDKLIAPSEAYRQILIQTGTDADRVSAIHNCIDKRFFDQPAPTEPGKYLLYVGRVVKEKGVDTLVKAMEHIPDVQLKVVGSGPLLPELQRIVSERRLNNVELCGFLRGDKLDDVYQNCLATVLPCNWLETFGLTVIESFAFGKPVIASALGALPELIDEGETGHLVPPGNETVLAEAMVKLWNDKDNTHQMGLTAKRRAEERFTIDKYVQQHIALYEQELRQDFASLKAEDLVASL